MNLINTLFVKYENLPPKRKALADMMGYLLMTIVCVGIIGVAQVFGFWAEISFMLLLYALYMIVKLLYSTRVSYYENLERLNKK